MERSVHYNFYPERVSDITEKILDELKNEKFFEQEDADYDITFKRFAEFFMTKWIRGEDLREISEEEFSSIIHSSIVESDLERLKAKNLLDCIEDENGEMLYFITKEGRETLGNINS